MHGLAFALVHLAHTLLDVGADGEASGPAGTRRRRRPAGAEPALPGLGGVGTRPPRAGRRGRGRRRPGVRACGRPARGPGVPLGPRPVVVVPRRGGGRRGRREHRREAPVRRPTGPGHEQLRPRTRPRRRPLHLAAEPHAPGLGVDLEGDHTGQITQPTTEGTYAPPAQSRRDLEVDRCPSRPSRGCPPLVMTPRCRRALSARCPSAGPPPEPVVTAWPGPWTVRPGRLSADGSPPTARSTPCLPAPHRGHPVRCQLSHA